jgi:hypothetical protein
LAAQWMVPSIVPGGLQWPHGVTARVPEAA